MPSPAPRRRPRALAVLAGLVLWGACSGGGSSADRSLTVFAAASLTDAFEALGEGFERSRPGVEVRFSFAGSSELAAQIVNGAPADVFAAADPTTMATVVDAELVSRSPTRFARNRAALVVAAGNPLAIDDVHELGRPELAVVLCAVEVPCGRYAQQVLDRAGVDVSPESLELNVRGVVAKVALGEADAGIVYSTDVFASSAASLGEIEGVAISDDVNVLAEYPIAALRDATDPELAQAFVDFVQSGDGQHTLAMFGFEAP